MSLIFSPFFTVLYGCENKRLRGTIYTVGIDVGAEELILVIRKNGKPFDLQKPPRW